MLGKRSIFIFFIALMMVSCSMYSYADQAPSLFLQYEQEVRENIAGFNAEICQLFAITPKEWASYKQDYQNSVGHRVVSFVNNRLRGKRLTARFQKIVDHLFARLKISSGQYPVFNVRRWLEGGVSRYAHTADQSIFIDEQAMTEDNLSDAEIEFSVLHELIHVIMDYGSVAYCIELCSQDRSCFALKKEIADLTKRFCHMNEKYADLFAGLAGGLDNALAGVQTYSRGNKSETDEHPALAARAAYMKKLYKQMKVSSYYADGNGCPAVLRMKF